MTDNVNRPSHYAEGWSNGAEVIDITENLNFNRGNAVKYIARAGKKDPDRELEDLQKAEFYLKREIYRIDPEQNRDPILDRKMADDAFFVEHMTAPVQPRVWQSLDDVPKNVKVMSKGKALWSWHSKEDYDYVVGDGQWLWNSAKSPGFIIREVAYGPFTEYLEDTE